MTTGIYALYWEGPDLVYIGQSTSIENRFKQHIHDCQNNRHVNFRIQQAFMIYGKPKLVLLEKTEDLNINEKLWIDEFDNTLNISSTNLVKISRKYSVVAILKAFSLLYRTKLSYKEVSNKSNLPVELINKIKTGQLYRSYLELNYPVQYAKMLNNRLIGQYASTTIFKEDVVEDISTYPSISDFCKKYFSQKEPDFHNARSGIGKVLNKQRKSYRGWKLCG